MSAGAAQAGPGLAGEINQVFGASWNLDVMDFNDYLTYKTEANNFTKLSGSFCEKHTGLAVGVNVDLDQGDNAISKANRVMGYLGYRRTYLRYQQGSLSGSYHWTGSLAPGMVRDGKFEQNFTHIDLLLWTPKMFGMPGFIGLGYTSLGFPVEVRTLYTNSDIAHQKLGTFVYDPDYKATYYSFLFGFDTFSENLVNLAGGLSTKKGFGIYMSGEDRFGFGTAKMGAKAIENARVLNANRDPVTDDFTSAFIENDTSMGIRWFSPKGAVGIGLGYEVSFMGAVNFSGAAQQPGDLGFDVMPFIFRHGPVARALMKW